MTDNNFFSILVEVNRSNEPKIFLHIVPSDLDLCPFHLRVLLHHLHNEGICRKLSQSPQDIYIA